MHNLLFATFFAFFLTIADRAVVKSVLIHFDINIWKDGWMDGYKCVRVILLWNIWLCFDIEDFQWKTLLLHFMKWKYISDKITTALFGSFSCVVCASLCSKFEILKYASILFDSYNDCEFNGLNEKGFFLIFITSIAFHHFNNIADSCS